MLSGDHSAVSGARAVPKKSWSQPSGSLIRRRTLDHSQNTCTALWAR
jgi:hypothetical protein